MSLSDMSLGRFPKTTLRFHSFLERLTMVREALRLRSRVSRSRRAQIHIARKGAAGAGSGETLVNPPTGEREGGHRITLRELLACPSMGKSAFALNIAEHAALK